MHWRAQCHAKWPRGSREFAGLSETHLNHSAIGLYQLPEKNSTGPTTGLLIFCQLQPIFLHTGLSFWDGSSWISRPESPDTKYNANAITWKKEAPEIYKEFKPCWLLKLRLELTQHCKSGSMFSSREPVEASSDCRRLGNTLCLCRPTQAVRPQELGCWFCPLNLLGLTLQLWLLTNELRRFYRLRVWNHSINCLEFEFFRLRLETCYLCKIWAKWSKVSNAHAPDWSILHSWFCQGPVGLISDGQLSGIACAHQMSITPMWMLCPVPPIHCVQPSPWDHSDQPFYKQSRLGLLLGHHWFTKQADPVYLFFLTFFHTLCWT